MAKRIFSVGAVGGVAVAAVLLVCTQSRAQVVASDQTAGYVVFPKIFVDTDDIFNQGRKVDTLIQLTNTSATSCRAVHCFYVDGTSHCSNGTNSADPAPLGKGACRSNADCDLGGTCIQGWQPGNFLLYLSPGQAIGWEAGVLNNTIPLDASCGAVGAPPNSFQTPIAPVAEHYFTGELKCVEVSVSGSGPAQVLTPMNANDLKGEATIYEVEAGAVGRVDVRSYNAIGIQSVLADGSTQNDQTMCLGKTQGSTECGTAEYASCPATLILDHWFDGAEVDAFDPPAPKVVSTDLTIVPCSEDLESQAPPPQTTTVQFLVYNEFEQRFSASTRVSCFVEQQLSKLDTPNDPTSSVFSVFVQGTLTGQTRIRPVQGAETEVGHGLLGIAEEFNFVIGKEQGSAAYMLNYAGSNQIAGKEKGDFVRVP